MIIGIISDTHGLIRPAALTALAGSDLIIHAGDVGSAAVLNALATIAPVVAVRGNCDLKDPVARLSETETIRAEGMVINVVHDLKQLKKGPRLEGMNIVISGHSHQPLVDRRGDILYINPGSAGPRRFRLPISVARLTIAGSHAEATIVMISTNP